MNNFILILYFFTLGSCSDGNQENIENPTEDNSSIVENGSAAINAVSFSGEENQYTFSVTILSDDTGCNQYADWWEVIDTDGNLIYRRILAHSHVNEQPFTRSGGPIEISSTSEVIVRAHMNNTGYGTLVFRGSISEGFNAANLSSDFAENLETAPPLPGNCAF